MIHIISTSISPLQPNIVPPSRLCFPSACLLVILVGPVVSFCPPCPCYPLCYCYPLMLSPCINQQSFGSSISVLTSYLDQESFPHSTSYPFFSCCTFVRHVGTAVVSVTNMMPDHSNTCQRLLLAVNHCISLYTGVPQLQHLLFSRSGCDAPLSRDTNR